MKIAILGAGSWAIGLCSLLHKKKHTLSMWEFNPDEARMLQRTREHPLKLPGIKIPSNVAITTDIHEAVAGRNFVICAVPAQKTRAVMKSLAAVTSLTERRAIKAWIIVSKGIECETLALMTDVLTDELPGLDKNTLVVLSGPSHAEEVSRGIPTTVVSASTDKKLAQAVQRAFSTDTFRVYTNDDVIGVELAGGVKNVIALSAGICDGLGLGDNTKGALLTRGLVEMMRLGEKMGAREETFAGLAGMGDLITTCISRHSRNRTFGEMIGRGLSMQEALSRMVMVAEGIETTRSTYFLARKFGVEMPITEQVYKTLFKGKSPRNALRNLMLRRQKSER